MARANTAPTRRTIYFDDAMWAELREIATAHGETVSTVLRTAAREYIAREKGNA